MFIIDSTQCTGCRQCLNICPQKAITIANSIAVIKQALCTQCGTCAAVCTAGAIRDLVPTHMGGELSKGGERMFYGYGRGFGFRGSSPPWPYIGRGRGGLPRCWHAGVWGGSVYPTTTPYWPSPPGEEQLEFLRDQASAIKRQLEDIESRIKELEKKE